MPVFRSSILGLLAALSLAAHAGEVTVSAAASLTNAFKDIVPLFESANPGAKVHLNFGASGALLAQITQADVEGWDASDERIAAFNQRLSENFSRRANRDNRQITFKSVNITDDAVELVFNVKRV